MPRQGQSVESCIITRWLKKPGDPVKEGDILFSYETDKAAFEEESHENGVLLAVFYNEGDEVPVLANVAVIGKSGEDVGPFQPLTGKRDEQAPSLQGKPALTAREQDHENRSTDTRKRISPRARKTAEILGIDPANLQGSGPMGRVIERDVRLASENQASGGFFAAPGNREDAKTSPWIYSFPEQGELRKISNVRRIIAANMQTSLHQSAQLTHHMSADARRMLSLREEVKKRLQEGKVTNVTINDMVCFAVIRALKKTPTMNIHYLGDQIRQFQQVHLGMAVDTERGLMVPVLRNADEYTLQGLSLRLKELAELCKKGNVSPELLAGTSGTFTVSNLGAYGVEMFTPVLNLPQVGILGVNTILHRPADIGGGTLGFIPFIGLSLTYDHRAIDGAPASAFLREIKQQIENIDFKID
ncbi:MAG: dihydrolipoamide acetyltransferase family protein [Bacteroidales bacterium]